MLATAALILIVTSKVVLGKDDKEPGDGQIYPLDMAPDSVDDMYDRCTNKMEAQVLTTYLNKEICPNISFFGETWLSSTGRMPGQDQLKIHNLIAIHMYSCFVIYEPFNQDVRTGKQNYQNNTYTWYSLHFFLTQAIQTLKKTQTECMVTYRGTNVKFNETVLYREIRFGSFASSSLDREVAREFGTESCFEIETCHGANVSKYSQKPAEEEVLIPPYETFNVTDIRKDDWCKTMFKLNSTGIRSDLNCAVASAKP
ncbi:erythroblast NAD(P)(+)--arginine ADP-ribosyltransferase-like [Misgurnus anguillicaudatus]|uniref:erythroblast NAD(P)(+)--arginine ADP-ribosyltransferase-like n=1 Tax=Misgurnus anguillicaudatus TaxID=75329 RepID=UPI003CCF6A29